MAASGLNRSSWLVCRKASSFKAVTRLRVWTIAVTCLKTCARGRDAAAFGSRCEITYFFQLMFQHHFQDGRMDDEHIQGQPTNFLFGGGTQRDGKTQPAIQTHLHALKDMEICGGDVHAFRPSIAVQDNPLWERILAARKNPLKQASLVGLDTLFLLLTRQLTLEQLAAFIGRKLGMRGQAVLLPYAEMGMDVDKDFQLEIMRNELLKKTE